MSKLLIVESPAKAKTITKYLGAGYSVKASMGHLRDLPKKEIGVDPDNNFQVKYVPIEGKDKVINELQAAADKADTVFLATDPDREGEAISWHLQQLLGLDSQKARRITFNEITKRAVTEAVEHPRDLDMDLVDAQQARRILDRIVGYKLSPFLWRKVRSGLSAGRVQSVVTRLVVDREREIRAFVPQEYWSITVTLDQAQKQFAAAFHGTAQGGKLELESEVDTQKILTTIDGRPYTVKTVKKSKKKRQPAPPFITSTLQQEASRKLGMASRRAMSIAQELYEGVEIDGLGLTGLITYMRTDSLRISQEALDSARDYITEKYGVDYRPAKARVFKTKKGAQDAHEAIRPSNPALEPDAIKKSLTPDQYKLYKLIWSRFVASQMAEAVFDTTSCDIENTGYIFRATGQTINFPGFLALYEEGKDEENEEEGGILPPLKEGDTPAHIKTEPKQHFTQPPARYTEASLIKAMEEKGIGRPSTYAPTISVVLDREYVAKEGKALRPTPLGEVVNDLIVDKFTDIVDVHFTAQMEDKLDDVENGKTDYRKVLDNFYQGFESQLKQAEQDLDKQRIKVPDEETDVVCENCGRKMVIKSSRFGKFLACPGYPECKNTKPITQEVGVPCPKCGAKLLKKKSKSGYYYYGCEKNPECDFMTWDTPQLKRQCPNCGGTVYRHYTKEDKRNMCHVPGCGWSEPIATRKKKAEEGDDAPKAPKKAAKAAAAEGEAVKAAKKPAAKKTAAKKPAAKKSTAAKPAAKKPAAKKKKDEA